MDLDDYGWDATFRAAFAPRAELGVFPGRVVRQARDLSTLVTTDGEVDAVVAGRFRHRAAGPADFPAVGDWVVFRPGDGGRATIEAILPRRSAFTRKAAGESAEAQVVAANVDTVLLVSGLDGDFNPRRIERYVTTAWSSGAQPVVVLNKADLRPDLSDVVAAATAVAPGVPVVSTSALDGDGVAALASHLAPGRTIALLGSSGVGKSTLVNALLGEERLATGPVSDPEAGRGRHTTTARELVRLPGGALLVDTPGLRELGLWADGDGLDRAFEEIGLLASRCRFPDCRHDREPGCAVRVALEVGGLDERRFAGYLKLRREMEYLESRKDERSRRRQDKAAGRDHAARMKEVRRQKPRYH
ncbi:MAG: ribosome small subunit-dependent GTPase A [Actinomycetota bacterium]